MSSSPVAPASRVRRSPGRRRTSSMREFLFEAVRGGCCGGKMVERNEVFLRTAPTREPSAPSPRRREIEMTTASTQAEIKPAVRDAWTETVAPPPPPEPPASTTPTPAPTAAASDSHTRWRSDGSTPFPNLPELHSRLRAYLENDVMEWLELSGGGGGQGAAAMSRAMGVVLRSAEAAFNSRRRSLLSSMTSVFGHTYDPKKLQATGVTGPLAKLCDHTASELMRANWPESVLLGEGQKEEEAFEEQVVGVVRSDLLQAEEGLACFAEEDEDGLLRAVVHHAMWAVAACALSEPPFPLALEEVGTRQRYDPTRHRLLDHAKPEGGMAWVWVVFPAVPDLFTTSLCLLEEPEVEGVTMMAQ